MANPTPKPNPDDAEPAKSVKPEEKPKQPKKEPAKPRVETILVRHDFADPDFAKLGKQLGAQQTEYNELETQLKAVKSDYKAKTDRVGAEIERLTNAIQSGFEMVSVEVIAFVAINKEEKSALKCYYRRDTGEFVKKEPVPLHGEMDLFALHPKPGKIKAALSDKIIASAV